VGREKRDRGAKRILETLEGLLEQEGKIGWGGKANGGREGQLWIPLRCSPKRTSDKGNGPSERQRLGGRKRNHAAQRKDLHEGEKDKRINQGDQKEELKRERGAECGDPLLHYLRKWRKDRAGTCREL